MSKPTSLEEYRARLQGQRSTGTLAVFAEDGKVCIAIDDRVARFGPLDALRVMNFIHKRAVAILRERTAGKNIRRVPEFKGVNRG